MLSLSLSSRSSSAAFRIIAGYHIVPIMYPSIADCYHQCQSQIFVEYITNNYVKIQITLWIHGNFYSHAILLEDHECIWNRTLLKHITPSVLEVMYLSPHLSDQTLNTWSERDVFRASLHQMPVITTKIKSSLHNDVFGSVSSFMTNLVECAEQCTNTHTINMLTHNNNT